MDGGIGVCIKSRDWKVLKQDDECKEICGDRIGTICQDGCTHACGSRPEFPQLKEGVHTLPNTKIDGQRHDAAVFVTPEQVVTFVYPVENKKARELAELKALGLSPRELEISGLALDGRTNREICALLYISLPTLKTHLNNIYRKIPESSLIGITLKQR